MVKLTQSLTPLPGSFAELNHQTIFTARRSTDRGRRESCTGRWSLATASDSASRVLELFHTAVQATQVVLYPSLCRRTQGSKGVAVNHPSSWTADRFLPPATNRRSPEAIPILTMSFHGFRPTYNQPIPPPSTGSTNAWLKDQTLSPRDRLPRSELP